MASFLKTLWDRLAGGGDGGAPEEAAEPVEYKGYRIRPTPYAAGGQFQTAGIIEKDFEAGPRQHRFIRAETHATKDDAVAFSITKAKQIVDQIGDRMFGTQ